MADPIEAELRERQKVGYDALLASAEADAPADRTLFEGSLRHRLIRSWSDAYRRLGGSPEIVEVEEGGFSYLFDLSGERSPPSARSGRRPGPSATRPGSPAFRALSTPITRKGI